MGALGVHFALTDFHVKKLRKLKRDEARLEHLQEELEEELLGDGSGWALESDKSWDAIHRSLTDGDLGWDNGEYPLNHVIMGGESLYSGDDYIMSLKTPDQVRDVARALRTVTREQLRSGYNRIREDSYGLPPSDEDFEYTWEWFTAQVGFWAKAASSGRYVLFTADQ